MFSEKINIKITIMRFVAIFWLVLYGNIVLATDKNMGAISMAQVKAVNQKQTELPLIQRRDSLFSLTLLDDKSFLLAGNEGLLVHVTKDYTNKKIRLDKKANLTSSHASTVGKVLVGTTNGTIVMSDNSLDEWSSISLSKNETIFNFNELTTGEIILSGSYGLLMSSKAPYNEWEQVDLPWSVFLKKAWDEFGEAEPHLYSGCKNVRGDLLIVGEFGLVIKRDPAGKWNKLHGGSIQPAIYDCDISDNGREILLVGQNGLVYQSNDAGLTWASSKIKNGSDLYSVKKIKDLSLIIGDKKNLYMSTQTSGWLCRRFARGRPLGWFIDMTLDNQEVAIVGSQGDFKLTNYTELMKAVEALEKSKEFVSCE